MEAAEKTFYVKTEDSLQERRLRASQCTVTILSTLFDLNQDRLYLSDGSDVEFPDSLGIFNTERFTNLDTLTVHGSSQQSQEVVPHHTGSMPSAGTLLSAPSPTMAQGFRTPARSGWVPSRGQGVRGKGKAACTTIKVVHANRKPDGSAGSNLSQCFLTLELVKFTRGYRQTNTSKRVEGTSLCTAKRAVVVPVNCLRS
jgi:hypothetical protein